MQSIPHPPGFYFFERGWLSSNNILLVDDEKATLIDTGYFTHADQTLALVQSHLSGRPLDKVINTHLHSDHCGGNANLQAAYPDAQIWIPPGHFDAVVQWNDDLLTYKATGQQCPRFVPHHVLQPGSTFESARLTWEVHAAPGHDTHSVILFEPQHRVLISADALWSNGFGVVFPDLDGRDAFSEVASTLDLIQTLDAHIVYPGHGAAFMDVSDAIDRARSRLDQFVRHPEKHQTYAIKVLLKFKLMEFQSLPLNDFLAWAIQTPYLQLMHHQKDGDISTWVLSMVQQLVASGAARIDGAVISNL
jgi:glyoxylase-like metal-dependent hydrolase (beta-lactamase superfamily II)